MTDTLTNNNNKFIKNTPLFSHLVYLPPPNSVLSSSLFSSCIVARVTETHSILATILTHSHSFLPELAVGETVLPQELLTEFALSGMHGNK